ncbi:hypothetical protein [Rhizobium sp. BK251]|uniref:hypothetical protein n=1 Tax=Rhizobium sp. BK251 TaxID=2512125 RepID=UPI001051914E|nr:hypothetical protein [Rhizobium sp. BK251]TCL70508.1 hypothetical protein EV286_107382 [Rhizobium sp. BK251]
MKLLPVLAVVAALAWPTLAGAEDAPALPASVIFVTSTGYWEDGTNGPAIERAPQEDKAATGSGQQGQRHGYYKLFAVRQPDRTAKIYLQQVAQSQSGPTVVSTVELEELSDLKPYVTDIRPESSTGVAAQPGLFATVYLRTDPAGESEGWTVLIDEFGEITVERATN